MYSFAHDRTYEETMLEAMKFDVPASSRTVTSSETIAAWNGFCREMVVDHHIATQQYNGELGGPGIIVQIDESMFGHRKYNRGRVLNEKWVLGIIAEGSDEVRMVVVDDRRRETLFPIIKEHVAVGSEIHKDSWPSYNGLDKEGFIHRKVNHSDIEHRFVAVDGTHTQRIESTWRPAKDWFRARGGFGADGNFAERLVEYLWRRHCRLHNIDLF